MTSLAFDKYGQVACLIKIIFTIFAIIKQN